MSGWSQSEFREFLKARIMSSPDDNTNLERVKTIAPKMNISTWTLYDILNGRIDLTPDRIPDIVNATGDIEILLWIIIRCKNVSINKLIEHESDGDVRDETLDMVSAIGKLAAQVKEDYQDGKLSIDEVDRQISLLTEIRVKIDAHEKELKNIRETVRTRAGIHVGSMAK